jgi:hypothetical protein
VTSSSAGMTEGYTDTLVGFQIVLFSRTKFSWFVIFSASVLARLWVKGTAVSITDAVLFCLSIGAVAGLLKSTVLSCQPIPVPFQVCVYSMAECLYQVSYTLWQSVGESFLPFACVSRDMCIQIAMSTPLLRVQLFRLLLSHFLHL